MVSFWRCKRKSSGESSPYTSFSIGWSRSMALTGATICFVRYVESKMASTKIMTEHSSIHGTMRSMEPNTVFIPTERRSTRPSESITA